MNKSWIVAGIIGLVAWHYVSKANAGKNIVINLRGLKLNPIKFGSPLSFTIYFTLTNPTSTPISISSFNGHVYINNKFLSNVNSTGGVTVPAKGNMIFPVVANITVADIANDISMLLNQRGKINLLFNGNVVAEGFQLPIQQTVTI